MVLYTNGFISPGLSTQWWNDKASPLAVWSWTMQQGSLGFCLRVWGVWRAWNVRNPVTRYAFCTSQKDWFSGGHRDSITVRVCLSSIFLSLFSVLPVEWCGNERGSHQSDVRGLYIAAGSLGSCRSCHWFGCCPQFGLTALAPAFALTLKEGLPCQWGPSEVCTHTHTPVRRAPPPPTEKPDTLCSAQSLPCTPRHHGR